MEYVDPNASRGPFRGSFSAPLPPAQTLCLSQPHFDFCSARPSLPRRGRLSRGRGAMPLRRSPPGLDEGLPRARVRGSPLRRDGAAGARVPPARPPGPPLRAGCSPVLGRVAPTAGLLPPAAPGPAGPPVAPPLTRAGPLL